MVNSHLATPTMRTPLPLLLALCLLATTAAADTRFRLCTLDQPFYPYTMPDGSGQLQYLLREASKGLPLQFKNYTAPRRRCLEDLKAGRAEGVVGAFAPERQAYAAFPLREGRLDESQALAVTRFLLYRLPGSRSQWDGSGFTQLDGKAIGVQRGFVHVDKLRASGAALDDGASSTEQNFDKLLLGRLAGVVTLEEEARRLLQGRFAGKIEAVEPPFDRTVLYLLVARPLYARQPELIEHYWQAIRAMRHSPAFKQYLQQYR